MLALIVLLSSGCSSCLSQDHHHHEENSSANSENASTPQNTNIGNSGEEPRGTCGLKPGSAKPLEHIVVDIPPGALYADTCLDGHCHGEVVNDCTDPADDCNEVIWGEVIDEDYRYVEVIPLYRDVDGQWRLITPVHPENPMQGGTVRLRLADEYGACEPVEFTVEPLEPAPGTLRLFVDGLRNLAEAKANLLGFTLQDLWALPLDEVPDPLLPLWVLHDVFEGDHPNSLPAMADGTAPIVQENPEALELFEALLARADVEKAYEEQVVNIENAMPPGGFNMVGVIPWNHPCFDFETITTAEKLEGCMEIAWLEKAALGKDSAATKYYNNLNTVYSVTGVIPHKAFELASFGASSGLWTARKVHESGVGMLPSELDKLEIELDGEWTHEDDIHSVKWSAKVRARSKGFDFGPAGLEAFIKMVLFAPGMPSVPGATSKAFRPKVTADDIADAKKVSVASGRVLQGKEKAIDTFENVTNAVIGEHTAQVISKIELGDLTQIEPKKTPYVDISDEEWSERQSANPHVIFQSHATYPGGEEARHDMWIKSGGRGQLVVRTLLQKPGKDVYRFAGNSILAVKEFAIPEIRIDAYKDREIAQEDNQELTFTVTLKNVREPGITAEARLGEIGSIDLTSTNDETYTYTVAYTGPTLDELAEEDDWITFRPTTTSGAFSLASAPDRLDIAIVSVRARVIVTPAVACLDAGESLQFEAAVNGLEEQTVTWSASEGTIDSDGLFVAPEGKSFEIAVTATSTALPDLSETVTIAANVCECWYSTAWSGYSRMAKEGETLSRTITWYPYFPTAGSYQSISFPTGDMIWFIPGLNVGYTGLAGPFAKADRYRFGFGEDPLPWSVSVFRNDRGGAGMFEFEANSRDILAGSMVPVTRRGTRRKDTDDTNGIEFVEAHAPLEVEFSIASDAGPRPQPGRQSYSCVVGE